MNASSTIDLHRPAPVGIGPSSMAAAMHDARDSAHRALFSAATRVLSYHAAALDARVARVSDEAVDPSTPNPQFVNG